MAERQEQARLATQPKRGLALLARLRKSEALMQDPNPNPNPNPHPNPSPHQVALHNMHRVLLLWPIITQLLLPAANHKSARIRIVGIEALVKVVIAAMRHHMQRARDAAKPHAAADEAAAAAPAAEGGEGEGAPWDKALMAPLEELQRRCVHRETQESILGAVHKILQACIAPLSPL